MPKPPRDTAQKWLAAGALITVAVGVSFASNALKNHLASSLPQKAPTSYAPLISSPPPALPATPEDEEEEDEEEDTPPATDRRTLPSGTPKTSAAAMPQWAHFDASRVGDKAVVRHAPIHSRAAEVFAASSAPAEDLSRAVIVCRGSTKDATSDLHLRVTVGTMPELASDAKKQLGRTYVSAPLVDAKRGQNVDATLFVRKQGSLTPVVEMHAKVGDGDLQRDGDAGSIACVALGGDELLDRIAQDAGRADASIAKVAALRVDTTKDFDIDPNHEEVKARRRIGDLAALTGWADPRVKARLVALDAALVKNDLEDHRAFDALYRNATGEAVVGDVTLTLDRIACTSDKCELAVYVHNRGTRLLMWERDELALNYLVAYEDRIDQETEGDHLEVLVLHPGQQRKTLLTAQPELGSARSLVQICIGRGRNAPCGVIRAH